jgi:hypothetical protein
MAKLLFQFRHAGEAAPALDRVVRDFGFREGEVDPGYGVVKVAEEAGGALYTVLVDVGARDRLEPEIRAKHGDPAIGFFSSPRIEPFGPPEP